MTHRARTTIAAVMTALFLAATSAAGLLAHGHGQQQPTAFRTSAPPSAVHSWHQEND